jgi:hypothetical protein
MSRRGEIVTAGGGFAFDGTLVGGEQPIPVEVRISAPVPDPQWRDYYCVLYAPPYVVRRQTVRGVTPQQAKTLALRLLRGVVDGRTMIDKEGNAVDPFVELEK